MSWSTDLVPDGPDTEVDDAIKEAARLTSDPRVKRWCESYLDGTDDEDDEDEDALDNLRTREIVATSMVCAVWPAGEKMLDAERLLQRLEAGVAHADAAKWAIAAAAFAALELIRFYGICGARKTSPAGGGTSCVTDRPLPRLVSRLQPFLGAVLVSAGTARWSHYLEPMRTNSSMSHEPSSCEGDS